MLRAVQAVTEDHSIDLRPNHVTHYIPKQWCSVTRLGWRLESVGSQSTLTQLCPPLCHRGPQPRNHISQKPLPAGVYLGSANEKHSQEVRKYAAGKSFFNFFSFCCLRASPAVAWSWVPGDPEVAGTLVPLSPDIEDREV